MATIEARERAQIRGGKMLAILKGEILNSRSFVHLKPTCRIIMRLPLHYCNTCMGLSFSPVVDVIADPRAAVHHLVHLCVAEV